MTSSEGKEGKAEPEEPPRPTRQARTRLPTARMTRGSRSNGRAQRHSAMELTLLEGRRWLDSLEEAVMGR